MRINVFPGVYPPSEDSYLLADAIPFAEGERNQFLEVGCGSGIVSITAAQRGWEVSAVDVNPRAVECTAANAKRNAVSISVFTSDLFERVGASFDLIAFNPPYLQGGEGEPDFDLAWSGGEDGRAVTNRFLEDVHQYLNPGGSVLIIQSSLSAPEETAEAFRRRGYSVEIVGQRRFFFETIYLLKAVKLCP